MSSAGPRLSDYLARILNAIERIGGYLAGIDEAAFLGNPEKQDAVIRNLEIIGEAAQSVRRRFPEVAATRPDIPWAGIYGMRNALTHGYFQVDLTIVWTTVREDLPALAALVRGALEESTQNSDLHDGNGSPTSNRSE